MDCVALPRVSLVDYDPGLTERPYTTTEKLLDREYLRSEGRPRRLTRMTFVQPPDSDDILVRPDSAHGSSERMSDWRSLPPVLHSVPGLTRTVLFAFTEARKLSDYWEALEQQFGQDREPLTFLLPAELESLVLSRLSAYSYRRQAGQAEGPQLLVYPEDITAEDPKRTRAAVAAWARAVARMIAVAVGITRAQRRAVLRVLSRLTNGVFRLSATRTQLRGCRSHACLSAPLICSATCHAPPLPAWRQVETAAGASMPAYDLAA